MALGKNSALKKDDLIKPAGPAGSTGNAGNTRTARNTRIAGSTGSTSNAGIAGIVSSTGNAGKKKITVYFTPENLKGVYDFAKAEGFKNGKYNLTVSLNEIITAGLKRKRSL
jgi:hypothetical protein